MSRQTIFTMLSGKPDFDLSKVLPDSTTDQINSADGLNTNGNIMETLGLVLLLIIIIIGAYYTSKFVAGIKLGQMQKSNFEIIDSYRIGPNKTLIIVKVGVKLAVLSVNKDSVTFLMDLEEDQISIHQDKAEVKVDFKQILSKMSKNKE